MRPLLRPLAASLAALSLLAAGLVACTVAPSDSPQVPEFVADPETGILALPTVAELARKNPQLTTPFMVLATDESELAAGFDKFLEMGHPTYTVGATLASWLRTKDTEVAIARTERIIDRWALRDGAMRLDYQFEYTLNGETLEPGWWSGMSDWTFPLLLTGLWQETGNAEYKLFAERMVEQAVKPVPDGGTIWYSPDRCWISEYAWSGMKQTQESYVLNGHQYALFAMGLLAGTTQDSDLAKLFRTCSESTIDKLDSFFTDPTWPSYMLVNETIDQPSYVIFEIDLFEALAALTGDAGHLAAAVERRDAMSRAYPIVGVEGDDANRIVFTQMAGPHPYLRDLYTVEVICSDGKVSETARLGGRSPALHDSFINYETALSLGSTNCDVWSLVRPDARVLIIEDAPVYLPGSHDSREVGFTIPSTINIDGFAEGDTEFRVTPSAPGGDYLDNQSHIYIDLANPLALTTGEVLEQFGIRIRPETSVFMSIRLIDGNRSCERHYPQLIGGETNLVLLATTGFPGCGDITTANAIQLIISRAHLDAPVTISELGIIDFDGPESLRKYLSSESSVVIPGI